ncbi:MAG TPA: tetratricopeptide repeat protein [Stellaceae bacterium]|nr:tetratricopeptide repeat protein [Stellaceae bacterium]
MKQDASKLLRQLSVGREHHRAGRLREAERAYRDVLRRDRGNPVALSLLGVIAAQEGRHAAAADFLAKALARDTQNIELHHQLAAAYRQMGDYQRAYDAYRRAAALPERFLDAHVECAFCAEEVARQAAERGDGAGEAQWRKRAAEQLREVGRLHTEVLSVVRALMAFRRAIELDPGNAELLCDTADLLTKMGRPSEGEPLYRQAIAADQHCGRAHNNLGIALRDLGRREEAEAAFRHALELEPDRVEAVYALGSGRLMNLCYRSDVSAEALFEAHRSWGAALVARQTEPAPVFANIRDTERRLRVGYVSPDFREHSTNHYFGPLLSRHDSGVVEVYLYGEVREPDAVTKRYQDRVQRWRSTVGMSDAEFRRCVAEDRIDVLIDLAGHTASTRLPALAVKPAPVTATWLGYPCTTGLPTIDYRLTDALADPPGAADHQHTETLIRLPGCFLCYEPPPGLPRVTPAPGLANGHVTFGSFNNLAKVTPEVVETWAAILREVPRSRLLLKSKLFADATVRQSYADRFLSLGIAGERLDFRPMIPNQIEHLGTYSEVDIGLDPFPYNGTTTTSEAMWMGVPVVTLIGDHHASRVGLSLVTQAGLAHLAATDRAGYVRIAADLARDLGALNALRLPLRERLRASPHGDAPRFARNFEAALREIWRRWCASEPL